MFGAPAVYSAECECECERFLYRPNHRCERLYSDVCTNGCHGESDSSCANGDIGRTDDLLRWRKRRLDLQRCIRQHLGPGWRYDTGNYGDGERILHGDANCGRLYLGTLCPDGRDGKSNSGDTDDFGFRSYNILFGWKRSFDEQQCFWKRLDARWRYDTIDNRECQRILLGPSYNSRLYFCTFCADGGHRQSNANCAQRDGFRSIDFLCGGQRCTHFECHNREYLVARWCHHPSDHGHSLGLLHGHPNGCGLYFASVNPCRGDGHTGSCRTCDYPKRSHDLLRGWQRELDIECHNGQYLVSRRRHDPNDCGYHFWHLYRHTDHFRLYISTFGTCDDHGESDSFDAIHYRFRTHDLLCRWFRDADQQQCLGQSLVTWKSDDTIDHGDRLW
jgi:hypothetical protein